MLPNTIICMQDGTYRELQELKPGDQVLGALGTNNRVVEILASKIRRAFRINGQIVVPGLVPFIMSDRATVAIPERRLDVPFHTMNEGYACFDESGETFPVIKIEEHLLNDPEPVLALILDGDQSFFANGFAVKCWFPLTSKYAQPKSCP